MTDRNPSPPAKSVLNGLSLIKGYGDKSTGNKTNESADMYSKTDSGTKKAPVKKNTKHFSGVSSSYSQLQMGLKSLGSSRHPKTNPRASSGKVKKQATKNTSKMGSSSRPTNPYIPDRSMSDFYCPVCDSHMNSTQMWASHIQGKRHQKNVKKSPGEPPSKIKSFKDDIALPLIQSRLDEIQEPLVGLKYICELRKIDPHLGPSYNCFLCSACLANGDILIEHLLGSKHKLTYLKEADPEAYKLVENLRLKKSGLEAIAEDHAVELEQKFGRGRMQVKHEKPTPIVSKKRLFSKESSSSTKKKAKVEPSTSPRHDDWKQIKKRSDWHSPHRQSVDREIEPMYYKEDSRFCERRASRWESESQSLRESNVSFYDLRHKLDQSYDKRHVSHSESNIMHKDSDAIKFDASPLYPNTKSQYDDITEKEIEPIYNDRDRFHKEESTHRLTETEIQREAELIIRESRYAETRPLHNEVQPLHQKVKLSPLRSKLEPAILHQEVTLIPSHQDSELMPFLRRDIESTPYDKKTDHHNKDYYQPNNSVAITDYRQPSQVDNSCKDSVKIDNEPAYKTPESSSMTLMDFVNRVELLEDSTLLDLLEKLSQFELKDDAQALRIEKALNNLTQSLMRYKIRKLEPMQQELLKEIFTKDSSPNQSSMSCFPSSVPQTSTTDYTPSQNPTTSIPFLGSSTSIPGLGDSNFNCQQSTLPVQYMPIHEQTIPLGGTYTDSQQNAVTPKAFMESWQCATKPSWNGKGYGF